MRTSARGNGEWVSKVLPAAGTHAAIEIAGLRQVPPGSSAVTLHQLPGMRKGPEWAA